MRLKKISGYEDMLTYDVVAGGHDEAERLPRGGRHHEGDETSKPGPGIKHVCVTSANLLAFGNTG